MGWLGNPREYKALRPKNRSWADSGRQLASMIPINSERILAWDWVGKLISLSFH